MNFIEAQAEINKYAHLKGRIVTVNNIKGKIVGFYIFPKGQVSLINSVPRKQPFITGDNLAVYCVIRVAAGSLGLTIAPLEDVLAALEF